MSLAVCEDCKYWAGHPPSRFQNGRRSWLWRSGNLPDHSARLTPSGSNSQLAELSLSSSVGSCSASVGSWPALVGPLTPPAVSPLPLSLGDVGPQPARRMQTASPIATEIRIALMDPATPQLAPPGLTANAAYDRNATGLANSVHRARL